jgi:hypothetical protein
MYVIVNVGHPHFSSDWKSNEWVSHIHSCLTNVFVGRSDDGMSGAAWDQLT